MSPKAQNIPFRGTGPNSTVQGLQNYKPRHTPQVQDVTAFSSFSGQGDSDNSAQSNFSLSSQMSSSLQRINSQVSQWVGSPDLQVSEEDNDAVYQSYAHPPASPFTLDAPAIPVTASSQALAFSPLAGEPICHYGDFSSGDFQGLTSEAHFDAMNHQSQLFMENLALRDGSFLTEAGPVYDSSEAHSEGTGSYPSPPAEPALLDRDSWNEVAREFENYTNDPAMYLPPSGQPSLPISPPLSEPSLQLALTTPCSQWPYSFPGSAEINPGVLNPEITSQAHATESMYSSDQQYVNQPQERARLAVFGNHQNTGQVLIKRLARPVKAPRPILSASSRGVDKNGSGAYADLALNDSVQQRVTDGTADRKHPAYHAEPGPDGLYHCPWAAKDNCQHKPVKQKCNFQ